MADNALALIQAKIAEIEAKLGKLRVAESELKKLSGISAPRAVQPIPTRRSKTAASQAAGEVADGEPKKSVTSRIRAFLNETSSSSAQSISEGIGVETRPISFALQALKRKGEVKMKDGEWSLIGRRKRA